MRRFHHLPFVFTLVLALSVVVQGPANADVSVALKKAYIASSRHFGIVNPGGLLAATAAADGEAVAGTTAPAGSARSVDRDLHNVQVNDPAIDNVQEFAGTRAFEFSIQSETSIARAGGNILVGYNSSADQPIVSTPNGLFFTHRHFSGYSVSHDGGKSWASGFVPANAGSPFTFGDPSVVADHAGNFYYAHLGFDPASGLFAVIVNKSTNGGTSFAPAKVAAVDDGSDKEWLAVGRDPVNKDRDNLYLTWTSFGDAGSELRFVRSTDGGATWSAQRTLFAPADTVVLSSFIQFSNPIVDASNGRLYIPFLHFSNSDADYIRVLVSDDAGATFKLLEFNVPGAPDKFAFPNVTPGTFTDCGTPAGGLRPVLRQGANLGGGRFGLPRYRQATRLLTQPTAAVANGQLYIAINSSSSQVFGDPSSRSSIRLLSSKDAGMTWSVSTLVPATAADPQHVMPALSMSDDGDQVAVAYFVQQADGRMRVDVASGQRSGASISFSTGHVSDSSFDLPPSMNPRPVAGNAFNTTNYDRTVQPCYALGEYLGIVGVGGNRIAAWGDTRNSWTPPPSSFVPGAHSQPDVFFQRFTSD